MCKFSAPSLTYFVPQIRWEYDNSNLEVLFCFITVSEVFRPWIRRGHEDIMELVIAL